MAKKTTVNQKQLGYLIGGLFLGALLMVLGSRWGFGNDNQTMMSMMGWQSSTLGMSEMMGNMSSQLTGKTGEALDQAFLEQMIVHHEGAIAMAEAVKSDAKHDEIKTLAEDVISAQTTEVNQMRQWQRDWGYPETLGMCTLTNCSSH